MEITGKKGGGSVHTPVQQSDTVQSNARMKMLLALSEGELPNNVTAKKIFLNGTPLENSDGSKNFENVDWEFRAGTQSQDAIGGFPAAESVTQVGVALKTATPWVIQLSDTSLDAVLITMGITSGLYETKLNGDMVGSTVNYKIEVATDGGSYKELVNKTVTEMISSNYELTHRVDLPAAKNSWLVRVTRITPDSTSARLVNATSVDSYTTVIDAKLRYPNTALLYVAFSGKQFSSTPTVSVLVDGKMIRVPSNYDAANRTYSGSWDGTFKWSSSNNPAWVWLDVLTNDRYGLGKRVNVDMVDKWELYRISQYCDQLVDDGKGGTEPRFLFDAYIQTAEDAWQVISDIAASFNGLSGWANNQFTVASDIPPDTSGSKIFTRANIVNGKITSSGGKVQDQYTSAAINFRDKTNHYNDATTAVMIPELVKQFGYRQLKLSPVGCTRESEAKRRGKWAIYTNYVDQNYTFQVGEEGIAINIGEHIFIANEKVSGKVYGGRVVSTSSDGKTLTLDRQTDAVAGDSIKVRCTGAVVKTSVIKSVSGNQVTVDDALAPVSSAVFVIDAKQIKLQGAIVRGKTFDDGANTYTITADEYNPSKQSAIDNGTAIEVPAISSLPSTVIGLPQNLKLKQQEQLQQSQRVVTIIGAWDAPENGGVIDYYQVQWKKDSGEWVNVQNTALRSFSVVGVFSGTYTFRVSAVLTNGKNSLWATSDAVNVIGRTGAVPVPTGLTVKGKVFGVDISWNYPAGSDDINNVLIQVADDNKGTNAATLSNVSYPATTYGRSDMAAGVSKWYRIKAVDKNGFESEFTSWVNGTTSSDAGAILDYISGKIAKTDLAQQLVSDIDSKATSADLSTANAAISQAQKEISTNKQTAANDVADAKKQASDAIAQAKSDLASTDASLSNSINAEAKARADAILSEQNARQADISTVKTLIQTGDQSLATQISQVAAGSGDQFDSLDIWYFDDKSADGWTSSGGNPAVSSDGWISPAAGNDPYLVSPTGLAFDSTAYRFVKLRIRKVGSPVWQGELRWREKSGSFDNTKQFNFPEPVYDANGTVTISIDDIPWTGTATIDAIRLDLTAKTDTKNYIECDWIAIGRPTPAAGMAALQDEQKARVNADAAEATSRNTLAVQLRGAYEGSDLSKVSNGFIAQESQARVSGDQANAQATTALGTKLDNSVSTLNQSISTLNTKQTATATDVTNLQSSLKTTNDNVAKKADASAVTSLSNTVAQQGNAITSTAQDVTNLQGSITSGNNLIPNPDLTANGAGWTPKGTATDGARVYVSSGNNYEPSTKNFDVNAGDTLIVSAELYCDKAIAVELRFRFDGPSMSNNTQTIQTITLAVNTWTTYGGSVVVPAGATTAQIQVTHASGTVRLANASVFAQNVSSTAFSVLNTKVTQQGDTITSQGNSITSLNNSIGKKADATALSDLSNKVTQQGNTISSQGNSITSLTNTVNNKADASVVTSLSSTVKSQGDSISTINNNITALQAALTSGNNLLANPDLLNGAAGWSGSGNGKDGSRLYSESNYDYAPNSQLFDVTAGDTLKVSGDVWADAAGTVVIRIRFDGPSMSNNAIGAQEITIAAKTWTTMSGVITVPSGASTGQLQIVHGGTARLSNPSVFAQNVTADAFNSLTNSVKTQGDTITSQGNSITSLNNTIKNKADTSALNDLTSKVTSQGNSISSQANQITSLTASTGLAAGAGNNLIQDGGFETYVSSNSRLLSDGAHRSGSKSAKIVRVAGTNTGGNNDVNYGNRFSVRGGAKIYIEIFARYDANSAAQTGSFNCGLNCQNTSGANSWRGAFTINQSDLPTNNSWVKYSGYAETPSDAVNAQLWFSVPQNSSNVQGVSILVDDVYAVDATEGYKAGQDSSANADAISSLSGKVTQQGNTITSQGNSITSLTNTVNNKADSSALNSLSNTVTQQGSTITSQGNRVTSLENNLTVGDNIVPNPTMLNNAAGWTGDATTIDGYPAVSSSAAWNPSSSKFPVTAGDVIDFSLMCQAAAAINGLAWGIRFDGPSLSNKSVYVASQNYTANEKKAVSGTITVPSGATTGMLQPSSNTTVKLSIYNIDVTRRNAGVVANSAAISNLSSTVSKQGDTITSQGNSITSINSTLGTKANASTVNDLNTKVTSQGNSITSQANQISSLNSTVGDHSSKISQTSSALSSLDGKVSASYTLKVEVDSNGNKIVTGFGVGADASGNSQFLVYANRFALINTDNRSIISPFAVENGQTFINQAFIKDGSITNAKVNDLMSQDFQENVRGWRFSKDGSLNINPTTGGSGGRMVITNNRIDVYDDSGKLRVRLGQL